MTARMGTLFAGGFVLGSMNQCYQSFEKAHAISQQDFERGVHYIDTGNYHKLPHAPKGRTPVFLPKDLPIVLKEVRVTCDARIAQMLEARQLLEIIGATHLVIPEARKYRGFLIEDRLPIDGVDYLEQMGLYVQNKDKFTKAIREFTAFLCRSELSDLWMRHDAHFLWGKVPSDVARFDNIPLYIENGEGKIGLIDLERLESHWLKADRYTKGWYENQMTRPTDSNWSILITIFPYHFEDILDVVEKMWPGIHLDREFLESQKNDALQTYEIGYIRHREFLNRHGINRIPTWWGLGSSTAGEINVLNKQQQAEIQATLKEFLEGWYNYDRENDRWNENHRPLSEKERKEMIDLVDRTTPIAISLLQKKWKESIAKCKDSSEDLVKCRSFHVYAPLFSDTEYDYQTEEYLKSEFRMEERNKGSFAGKIVGHLLKKMKEYDVLYDYGRGIRV